MPYKKEEDIFLYNLAENLGIDLSAKVRELQSKDDGINPQIEYFEAIRPLQ
jgi:hypothetical protein